MIASSNVTKFINKKFANTSRSIRGMKRAVLNRCITLLGRTLSIFSGARRAQITTENLYTKSGSDIVVNCLGCTDLSGHTASYAQDLKAIRSILANADISFTSARFGKQTTNSYGALMRRLQGNRIINISHNSRFIGSKIYQTKAGKFATISYIQNSSVASKRHVRTDLLKEYFTLKRMGAEYVIMYIDSTYQELVTEKDKQLCDLLLWAGVDYIVLNKPYFCDSGVTYMQKNRAVSRAVYSMGTFLSDRDKFPQERVIMRLKLRRVNGKLQAFEEAYYPLRYSRESGFKVLIGKNKKLNRREISSLAAIEKSMPRLRKVDQIITVGKVVEIVGAELPEKFNYLADFSVGRISARPFVFKPGDVYVRWQPHTEVNDADTYKERVKQAKKSVIAASKTALFMVSYKDFRVKIPYVVVPNALEAHVSLGAHLRKQHDVRCVAITGSIGKTSTKDMVAEVMKLQYNTVKSEKNSNIHSKISLALQKITSDCEVYIQELGGGRPGGASRHSRMVQPEVVVVTNIGDAHLGNFHGDKNELMQNKLQIADGMPSSGVIYLNGDDPMLAKADTVHKKVLYAVHNKDADYYAENLIPSGNKTYFDIVYGDKRVPVCVKVPGEHNVLNAVCAFAIGKQFGIPETLIVQGIGNFKTQGIRQNIVNASGMKLFFDCFNASSGSVESSIDAFAQIQAAEHGKHIAVIGDITGLGDQAESAHKEIANALISKPADLFIFYGTDIKHTYEIVKERGFEAYYTPDFSKLCDLLKKSAKPGDVVMVKGSGKLNLEYAFDCVFGTRAFDRYMLEEGAWFRAEVDNVAYNLFSTHATAVKPLTDKPHVRVKERVGMVRVQAIATTFATSELKRVTLPDSIWHIGIQSFRDCENLISVEGAKHLKYIGLRAFKNCKSLETLYLPETLMHIGNEAFYGCTSLKHLHIPESVAQIGLRAFDKCPNLKITCKAGSYAESYLKTNMIEYTCV